MTRELDLNLSGGRTLHVYDTGGGATDDRLAVFWHHGTPNVGSPPEPLFPAAARLDMRWVSYDRPGYGGSTPLPGRDLASAAEDVCAIADALGIGRLAVFGHSGGGSHALACGALLPDRVVGVVSVAGLAPLSAAGLDWFAGMAAAGAADLHAAIRGRSALADRLARTTFDPEQFTTADHAALEGVWRWLGVVAGKANEDGPDGMLDDDLAYVAGWGFEARQSACRSCWFTVARTVLCRPPMASGWPGSVVRRTCGRVPVTGTSRYWAPARRRWTGSTRPRGSERGGRARRPAQRLSCPVARLRMPAAGRRSPRRTRS